LSFAHFALLTPTLKLSHTDKGVSKMAAVLISVLVSESELEKSRERNEGSAILDEPAAGLEVSNCAQSA
jgi:hypothetical protein